MLNVKNIAINSKSDDCVAVVTDQYKGPSEKVVMVGSGKGEDGKTSFSINLATLGVMLGLKTLLIDLNLAQTGLRSRFMDFDREGDVELDPKLRKGWEGFFASGGITPIFNPANEDRQHALVYPVEDHGRKQKYYGKLQVLPLSCIPFMSSDFFVEAQKYILDPIEKSKFKTDINKIRYEYLKVRSRFWMHFWETIEPSFDLIVFDMRNGFQEHIANLMSIVAAKKVVMINRNDSEGAETAFSFLQGLIRYEDDFANYEYSGDDSRPITVLAHKFDHRVKNSDKGKNLEVFLEDLERIGGYEYDLSSFIKTDWVHHDSKIAQIESSGGELYPWLLHPHVAAETRERFIHVGSHIIKGGPKPKFNSNTIKNLYENGRITVSRLMQGLSGREGNP